MTSDASRPSGTRSGYRTHLDRRAWLAASLAAGVGTCSSWAHEPVRDVAWLKQVQTPPDALPKASRRLEPLLVDADGEPIRSLDQWRNRREELRGWWLKFLGSLGIPRDKPPKLETLAEDRVGNVLRQLVRYEPEPGWPVEAYLLRPEKLAGPAPGVAVFHSTVNHSIRQPAGVEGKPEKAFGLKLAQRGCITISPRNFLWPTNHKISAGDEARRFLKRHPKCKGMAKMLFDAQQAVDILAAQPGVDANRLGAVGHSLGAKEVLYLAAFDERIKVTVSSEGGVGTRFSNWNAPWYLGPTIKSADFNREHHELLALAAPRPFLLIGGDSADGARSWPFIQAALPVYRLYANTARLGLLNHGGGHAVPPVAENRTYEWFDAYL